MYIIGIKRLASTRKEERERIRQTDRQRERQTDKKRHLDIN